MTPEQKQQLDQIIKRHNQQPPSTSTMTCWKDIDFLLSLVKSQEAEPDLWLPIEAAPKSDTIWLVVAKIADSEPNKGAVLWWYRAMFWRGAWRTSRDYSGTIVPTHFFDPEQVITHAESVTLQEQE